MSLLMVDCKRKSLLLMKRVDSLLGMRTRYCVGVVARRYRDFSTRFSTFFSLVWCQRRTFAARTAVGMKDRMARFQYMSLAFVRNRLVSVPTKICLCRLRLDKRWTSNVLERPLAAKASLFAANTVPKRLSTINFCCKIFGAVYVILVPLD